jgi:excisionase family DNA binding protein
MDKAYGTIPQATSYTGMSRTCIYSALKDGRITARKVGRRTLVSFADLDAYLSSLPAYRAGK